MRLANKTALVTGSNQGIGQAIALRLAEEGANIAVNYRKGREGGEQTAKQISDMGRRSAVIQADISKLEDGRRLLQESIAALGSIDILVNNAGVEISADFWDVKEEDYRMVMDINLNGPFFLTQGFVRHRREAGTGGKIINISSVHEDLPFPHFTSYCMSKGGLKMMTRNLSIELASLGITINNVAPGAIETPINTKLLNDKEKLGALLENIPLRRLGKPEDVAGLVAFLASPDADYVTGTTYFVDGGLTWNYTEQ